MGAAGIDHGAAGDAAAIGELDRSRAPGGDEHFAALLCWQARHAIAGTASEKSFRLSAPQFTDLGLEGWSLVERDASRMPANLPGACTTLGLQATQ